MTKKLNDIVGEGRKQINELSRKTLGSYVKKAVNDLRYQDRDNAVQLVRLDYRPDAALTKSRNKAHKRASSIGRAADKLAKEEVDLKSQAKELSNKIDSIVLKGGKVDYNDPLNVKLSNLRKKIATTKKK